MEDKLAETRHKALTESLDKSNTPRFGYFGLPGALCIGDDSYAPRLVRKPKAEEDDSEPIRNIQTGPLAKGSHPKVFFQFTPPLCIDDPYQDSHRINKKGQVTYVDPDNKFKPPGKVRQNPNKLGYSYEYHMDGVKDPKAVKEQYQGVMPPRQIYSNPMKKGGGGTLTQGVLFGYDEERRAMPEHKGDDYDAAKKMRKQELDEHLETVEKNHPGEKFKQMTYGGGNFQNNKDSFGYDVPTHIPREPKPDNIVPYEHGVPFVPANPMKKGMLKGLLGKVPEYMEDPMPSTRVRKDKGEDKPDPFKLGCSPRNPKPTPSVTTFGRNLRNERPSSFARPLL